MHLEQVLYVNTVDSVLLIGTLNREKLGKNKNHLNEIMVHELTDSIDLNPLSRNELKVLIERIFQTRLFLDKEVEMIHNKTQGLPILVREFLMQLISKGLITTDSIGWRRQDDISSELRIYSSLVEVFAEKWNNLTKAEKWALRFIAFYDSNLKFREFEKMVGIDGDRDLIFYANLPDPSPKQRQCALHYHDISCRPFQVTSFQNLFDLLVS